MFGLDRFLFFIICIRNDDDINQVSRCLVISLSTPLTLLSQQRFQLDITYRSRFWILYILPITLFDQRITAVLFLQNQYHPIGCYKFYHFKLLIQQNNGLPVTMHAGTMSAVVKSHINSSSLLYIHTHTFFLHVAKQSLINIRGYSK